MYSKKNSRVNRERKHRVAVMEADSHEPLAKQDTSRSKTPAWEHALSIIFAALLVMMAGNIGALALAWQYNDAVCRTATMAAGEAIMAGDDRREVMHRALDGLNKSAINSMFMDPPTFTQFKEEAFQGGLCLRIETTAQAPVPAPFLIPNVKLAQDGKLRVSRSYLFKVGQVASH